MDCKRLQEIFSDLSVFEEESLTPEAKQHLARCPECRREFNWLRTLIQDFKSLKLPSPEPAMWENMAHRIQTSLMVGRFEEEEGRWFRLFTGWFNRPSFVYGVAAAAVLMVAVMWGTPHFKSPLKEMFPLSARKGELVAYTSSLPSIFDPTISRVLESIPERELSACVSQLVRRSFDRKELAAMANDPVVTVENTISADQDIYQLNDRELQQVSSLLGQKYQQ